MKLFLNKSHDESQLGKLLFFLRDLFPSRIEEIIRLAADMSYGMTIELKPQKTNRSRPQETYYISHKSQNAFLQKNNKHSIII